MTKSVHFSSTNLTYSPLLWSPSPGASTSSLPPSPSKEAHPLLPESHKPESTSESPNLQQGPPYRQLPQPTPIVYSAWASPMPLGISPSPRQEHVPFPSGAQIHSLLAFTPFAPPNVQYDVSHPLHTINSQFTPWFLNPATYPPLPALTVFCRHFAWPIAIFPSQPTGYVSVIDVFTSVYTSLRLAVRRAEYDTLPSSGMRQKVDYAYFARCRLLSDENDRKLEALQGVKRVDFLLGKTRFLGLSGPVDGAHQIWELNVS